MADPSHSSPTAAAAGNSLLAPATSGAPEAALPASPPDLDAEFGFQRPELGKEKLAGPVVLHTRYVFLCYKSPASWPSHVEATESDRLPRILAAAIKARKSNLKMSTKLIIFEGEDCTESSLGDVLIFPDKIRYRGLTHFDVDNFVENVLVKDVEWLPGSPERIRSSYVFVCTYGSKDKRCGVCGPALIARFKEEIEGQGLHGKVAVCASASSKVAGHKYAGHLMIFSSDAKGEVTSHWYGYVAPDDVPMLLHNNIGQGETVDHLWRGQLVMTEEGQKKALELKRMKNGTVRKGRLFIPEGFDGDARLKYSDIHGFETAQELHDAIEKFDTYLLTKMAAALLTNPAIFAVESEDVREQECLDGAVGLLDSPGLELVNPRHDLYTSKIIVKPLQERQPEICPIGDLKIIRRDFGGNRWIRRRSVMEGNDRYHILQWLPQLSEEEFRLKRSISHKKKPTQHEEAGDKEFRLKRSISHKKKPTQHEEAGDKEVEFIPQSKKTGENQDDTLVNKPNEALEIQQKEDETLLENSIVRLAQITWLTPTERAMAVLVLKDQQNRVIFAAIKDDDFCKDWLLLEIQNLERILDRGKGSGP